MALANIPLSEIEFGSRGREDYGDLSELIDDINRRGLICPITVIDKQKAGLPTDSSEPFLLAAGGRRFSSVKALDWSSIDCRVYEREMNELDYREIELFENLKRKKLTFDEELQMKSDLNELYVQIHGPKVGRSPDAPGHSVSDTAEILGIDKNNLNRDLSLKKTMDQFKDVDWKKCKNKSDAHKLAKKLKRTLVNANAAEEIQKELDKPEHSVVKLVCDSFVIGNFFEESQLCPDLHYDIAEIDPPYAINLTAKKKGNACDGYNEIDAGDYAEFMENTFRVCYKKLKPNAWLLCWFGPDPWYPLIHDLLELAGFSTTGLVGIWGKGQEENEIISSACGQTHMPNTRLANSYEMFYYAWKGSPELNRPGKSNLFGCVPVPHTKKWHPTQRPRPLIRDLLSTFCPPGSNVFVPFAGSGETLISAFKENMRPVGFELNSTYKDSFMIEAGKEFAK